MADWASFGGMRWVVVVTTWVVATFWVGGDREAMGRRQQGDRDFNRHEQRPGGGGLVQRLCAIGTTETDRLMQARRLWRRRPRMAQP